MLQNIFIQKLKYEWYLNKLQSGNTIILKIMVICTFLDTY